MIHEDALPGHEFALKPKPEWEPRYPGSDRLEGKVALITGAYSLVPCPPVLGRSSTLVASEFRPTLSKEGISEPAALLSIEL